MKSYIYCLKKYTYGFLNIVNLIEQLLPFDAPGFINFAIMSLGLINAYVPCKTGNKFSTFNHKKVHFLLSDFGKLLVCYKTHIFLTESVIKPFVAICPGLTPFFS